MSDQIDRSNTVNNKSPADISESLRDISAIFANSLNRPDRKRYRGLLLLNFCNADHKSEPASPMLRTTMLKTSSDRQSGFRKTVSNPPDVCFVLERLPSEMLAEGVSWVNLFEFSPDTTSFFAITKMT
jgi:hypothetical protein